MTILLDIFLLALLLSGMMLFLRNPSNISFIIMALNSVFLIFPMLLYQYFSPSFLEYAMGMLRQARSQPPYTEAKLWIALLSATWCLGAITSERVALRSQGAHPKRMETVYKLSPLWIAILSVVPAVLFFYSIRNLDMSLRNILLPARIERGTHVVSPYFEMLMLAIPTIISCLIVCVKRRITLFFILFASFSLLLAVSTSQRRTMVLVAATLLICVVFAVFRRKVPSIRVQMKKPIRKINANLMYLFGLLALMGPFLWAARNYSSKLVNGLEVNLTEVLHLRGFWELFFGSTATGFPTTVLVVDMMRETSASIMYSISFLFSAPIPRAIWPNKPIAPGGVLEQFYDLGFSPSLFLFPELIMNFMAAAPIFAFLLAFTIGRVSKYLFKLALDLEVASNYDRVFFQILFAILAPQTATMFKNGITAFMISALIWTLMTWFIYTLCVKRRRGIMANSLDASLARKGS